MQASGHCAQGGDARRGLKKAMLLLLTDISKLAASSPRAMQPTVTRSTSARAVGLKSRAGPVSAGLRGGMTKQAVVCGTCRREHVICGGLHRPNMNQSESALPKKSVQLPSARLAEAFATPRCCNFAFVRVPVAMPSSTALGEWQKHAARELRSCGTAPHCTGVLSQLRSRPHTLR